MELNIYSLFGMTTNECRKYWVLPTPLYTDDIFRTLFLLRSFWLWLWLWFLH